MNDYENEIGEATKLVSKISYVIYERLIGIGFT